MPNFSVFKIFQIFGIVSAWATKAFADGVVTLTEAIELAISLCAILGIATQLDLPNQAFEQVPETIELAQAEGEDVEAGHERPPPERIQA